MTGHEKGARGEEPQLRPLVKGSEDGYSKVSWEEMLLMVPVRPCWSDGVPLYTAAVPPARCHTPVPDGGGVLVSGPGPRDGDARGR